MSTLVNNQNAENSILDVIGAKQMYLGNQFIFSEEATTSGTAEAPLLLIRNPVVTASASPVGSKSIFIRNVELSCYTNSQTAIYRFYINPTITGNGAAAAALNARSGSSTASVAIVTTTPTVSANGTLLLTLGVAAFGNGGFDDIMAILDPGANLLITVQASASAAKLGISLGWYEL